MCVIIYKPAGVSLPDYETFAQCWDTNPDGFGMCWSDGKTVTIDKGYMDAASAWLAMSKTDPAYPAVYHFRISTSGLVDSGACHPYPVTREANHLRALRLVNLPYAVAHNGVIGVGGKVLNDTQLWVQNELYPYMGAPRKAVHKFMDDWAQHASSRFVILYGDGKVHLSGTWHKDDATGLWFSNTHWEWGRMRSVPRVSDALSGYMYEWDEWSDTYEDAVYEGYTPICPVCGNAYTIAHTDSPLSLCECEDCHSVFNGQTGDIYVLDTASSFAYRGLNEAEAKKAGKTTRKAAYYGG